MWDLSRSKWEDKRPPLRVNSKERLLKEKIKIKSWER
jgi:hypothetical protein